MNCTGNRRRYPRQTNLGDTPCTQLVEDRIGMVQERNVQRGRIRIRRDDVIGEIAVDWRAGPLDRKSVV